MTRVPVGPYRYLLAYLTSPLRTLFETERDDVSDEPVSNDDPVMESDDNWSAVTTSEGSDVGSDVGNADESSTGPFDSSCCPDRMDDAMETNGTHGSIPEQTITNLPQDSVSAILTNLLACGDKRGWCAFRTTCKATFRVAMLGSDNASRSAVIQLRGEGGLPVPPACFPCNFKMATRPGQTRCAHCIALLNMAGEAGEAGGSLAHPGWHAPGHEVENRRHQLERHLVTRGGKPVNSGNAKKTSLPSKYSTIAQLRATASGPRVDAPHAKALLAAIGTFCSKATTGNGVLLTAARVEDVHSLLAAHHARYPTEDPTDACEAVEHMLSSSSSYERWGWCKGTLEPSQDYPCPLVLRISLKEGRAEEVPAPPCHAYMEALRHAAAKHAEAKLLAAEAKLLALRREKEFELRKAAAADDKTLILAHIHRQLDVIAKAPRLQSLRDSRVLKQQLKPHLFHLLCLHLHRAPDHCLPVALKTSHPSCLPVALAPVASLCGAHFYDQFVSWNEANMSIVNELYKAWDEAHDPQRLLTFLLDAKQTPLCAADHPCAVDEIASVTLRLLYPVIENALVEQKDRLQQACRPPAEQARRESRKRRKRNSDVLDSTN